jgi:hypothetical protein
MTSERLAPVELAAARLVVVVLLGVFLAAIYKEWYESFVSVWGAVSALSLK